MSKREQRRIVRATRRRIFVEAWRRAQAQGVSLSAFCRDAGLCRKSFYSWLRDSGQGVSAGSCIRRTDPSLRQKALDIFMRYRGTWTAETISLALGDRLSIGTIRSICRPFRGFWDRSKTAAGRISRRVLRAPQAPNLLWSADWTEWRIRGKKFFILVVIDEAARFFLGSSVLARRPRAEDVRALLSDIFRRYCGRPLLLKSDRAKVFKSAEWEALLAQTMILPHRINPRSPWEQGIVERAIRELKDWLRVHDIRDQAAIEDWVDEGMLMLNFFKPKAVLQGATPAAYYFRGASVGKAEQRTAGARGLARGGCDA